MWTLILTRSMEKGLLTAPTKYVKPTQFSHVSSGFGRQGQSILDCVWTGLKCGQSEWNREDPFDFMVSLNEMEKISLILSGNLRAWAVRTWLRLWKNNVGMCLLGSFHMMRHLLYPFPASLLYNVDNLWGEYLKILGTHLFVLTLKARRKKDSGYLEGSRLLYLLCFNHSIS